MKQIEQSPVQAVWLIRPGRDGEAAHQFLTRGVVSVGWKQIGDPRRYANVESMKAALRRTHPGDRPSWAAGTIRRFYDSIRVGDVVLAPIAGDVHVGLVLGHATYQAGLDLPHRSERTVEWRRTVSRGSIGAEAWQGLPARGALLRVKRVAAEWAAVAGMPADAVDDRDSASIRRRGRSRVEARAGEPGRTSTLVLQRAAGKAAQRNFERTVQNSWTVGALERLGGVSRATLADLRRAHGSEPFGIWATTRGKTNLTTPKFEMVGRHDVVAFLAKGSRVFYAGRVGATVHDLTLGDRLGWERPPSKLPYEHIYTITHGHDVDVNAKRELREWLPRNGVVLGFSVKEVPVSTLRILREGLTASREVVVPAQPDDAPRDERDAAHRIRLRDVAHRERRPLADDAFQRRGDPKRHRELLQRAEESHRKLLKKLRDAFEAGGAKCKEDPSGVDLLVSWADLTLVVEVKSTWGGFVGPVRNAVGQLYEYCYHLTSQQLLSGDHVLVLALDRAPRASSWLHDYITHDRGMTLVTQGRRGTLRVEGPRSAAVAARVPQISQA